MANNGIDNGMVDEIPTVITDADPCRRVKNGMANGGAKALVDDVAMRVHSDDNTIAALLYRTILMNGRMNV